MAAALAFPAYARNAELNIQVHGGIGFTWEHDAHLHLRRALVLRALFGGDAPARDVFDRTAAGVTRSNSLDLPAEAEELRARIRADAAEIAGLDEKAQLAKLIETGYVMPHWPKPWGRAADAVEQLVIEQEFAAAGIKRPDYSITGWVILTLIQHGTDSQIERFVLPALRQEEIWCQLFSEPDAGSDAAGIKTRGTRVEGAGRSTGRRCGPAEPSIAAAGWRLCAPIRTPEACGYHRDDHRHEGARGRGATAAADHRRFGIQRGVLQRRVRARRRRRRGAQRGWTVARATLGNERVSIGAAGRSTRASRHSWCSWLRNARIAWRERLFASATSWPRIMRCGC
ncbi:acyl-CoA dehydrogenase, C-terminal domain protein [Mycobacterium xenopi 4042]|uniref:Acyl-CoA dehydrogenase, C-terminal domain protein n=1 Tax=Mycobacterium xenopi 4042 TaxID=1299334 RepID=X7Z5I1_MYCXE|nr:acyl-CoA dehydrogenase, C-terminal domain protein [Mycobacterium xenopi 4042]